MKIINISILTVMSALIASSDSYAGVVGGGGPPSRQAFEDMLMSQDAGGVAGLFGSEEGGINLGINRPLGTQLTLSRIPLTQSLKISDADFGMLKDSETKTIHATALGQSLDLETSTKSYRIEDGNELGELLLKDRRELIRAFVK